MNLKYIILYVYLFLVYKKFMDQINAFIFYLKFIYIL